MVHEEVPDKKQVASLRHFHTIVDNVTIKSGKAGFCGVADSEAIRVLEIQGGTPPGIYRIDGETIVGKIDGDGILIVNGRLEITPDFDDIIT